MENKDRYFDIKELSKYSSLSVSTLRSYLSDASDPIPSYCIKRKILVRKSAFDAWIEKHRVYSEIGDVVNEILGDFETQ